MSTSLVLTVIGADRPGLVEAISNVVTGHDANWEASRMARLAGRFAGILRVTVDAGRAEDLAQALRGLEPEGLKVTVEDSDGDAGLEDQRELRLELVGNDHPGIIRDISRSLAEHGISVVELATDLRDAPMAGGNLFAMHATLRCPASVTDDQLRATLESLADSLMVDIHLD